MTLIEQAKKCIKTVNGRFHTRGQTNKSFSDEQIIIVRLM